MINKTIAIFMCFLLISVVSFAREIDKALLQGYDAALVIYNRTTGETVNIDSELSARRLSPCSTFKIYNTLIGLELGMINGADEPWYKWDGVKRFIDGWDQDLTLREAFRVSAVPAYQILAREIGEARMKEYIGKIGYGSEDISAGIDIFWLPRPDTVSIMISADEQAALLNKLLDGKLPFSLCWLRKPKKAHFTARPDQAWMLMRIGIWAGLSVFWRVAAQHAYSRVTLQEGKILPVRSRDQ